MKTLYKFVLILFFILISQSVNLDRILFAEAVTETPVIENIVSSNITEEDVAIEDILDTYQETELTVYENTTFFNDETSYKIAAFVPHQNDDKTPVEVTAIEGDYKENSYKTISLGLFTQDNQWLATIFQYTFEETTNHKVSIHSIQLRDLNMDTFQDIIVNVTESGEDYFKVTSSYFLINKEENFTQLEESFSREQYEFKSDTVIQVSEPLYAFGTPYEEDQSGEGKQETLWQNYYEFQGDTLVLNNHRYKKHYEKLYRKSKKSLSKYLLLIKEYRLSKQNPEIDQLQLNEYFHEVTTQKLLIQRCEDILYN